MDRLVLCTLLGLCACHAGFLAPTGEGPEADTDTDADADTDTDTDLVETGGPCDTKLDETGDEQSDAVSIGGVTAPHLICGDLYASSNDGAAYTGDFDWTAFVADQGSSWNLSLRWEDQAADLDLFLLDGEGGTLAAANTEGTTQPEQMDFILELGQAYHLVVVGWDAAGGVDYELELN
jgi:hypothetical protein